jgi:hypothetical protein
MLTWMFERLVVFCATVCVLLLFLFPAVHGPFQATHGPTTAFRARNAFLVLLFSILHAAACILCRLRNAAEICFRVARRNGGGPVNVPASDNPALLRC